MDMKSLIGLTLDGCRFSKGSYTLDFSGKTQEEFRKFSVSTSYNLSSNSGEDDIYRAVSTFIWPFLDLRLTGALEKKDESEVIFEFENDEKFTIWADDDMDNLLIITDLNSGKWSSVL